MVAVPSSIPSLLCIWFIIVFSSHPTAHASVHEYARARFTAKGNAYVLHGGSEGLYASPGSSTNISSSNAESYIRLEKITFRRTKRSAKSAKGTNSLMVQAIVFEVDDQETIGGSAYGGQRAVCCASDLAKLGACKQGEVIYRPSRANPLWPQVFSASFGGDDLEASLESRSIQITKTGMYNLYFIYCNPELKGLIIEGKTIWKNPTGYLPGRMAPLKNFYWFMSLAFIILAIFWFSQYVQFWREVVQLQNCITLVIALGMFEMALWYFDYARFNKTGVRPSGITMWAVTFGTAKLTASRLIILLVSMGYGVVRPTLGGLTSKAIMLGATFFLASELLQLSENAGTINDLPGKASLFLVLPEAILDTFFIIWIFTSLSKTLDKLQARRVEAKLDIYRKFTNALVVAVIVSACLIAFELYFKSSEVHSKRWRIAWIIPSFWQVLSFCLLSTICVLWAPSRNSTRYAYSEGTSEDFDEDSHTLRKLAPLPSMNVWNASAFADTRTVDDNNGISLIGNTEENKRE